MAGRKQVGGKAVLGLTPPVPESLLGAGADKGVIWDGKCLHSNGDTLVLVRIISRVAKQMKK